MKFTKMQGCGNDYVYVDAVNNKVEDREKFAVSVSDRRFGIGSDGLICIAPSKVADFAMDMYNADGSRGKMCGNGIRCLGKFVYDHGLTDKTKLTIETLSGVKYLELNVVDGKVDSVTVDMGAPETEASKIPAKFEKSPVLKAPFATDEKVYSVSCVSMGNPHAVVYVDDVSSFPVEQEGKKFEHSPVFPEGVNTEFVQVLDRGHIKMRVWERGSGETFACGTGACGCAYVSMLNGLVDKEVFVEMLGGTLKIKYDDEDGHIYMTGPAVTTFEGETYEIR
ncbi:MAG: diaminopimelate epimerase [Lachnospiraceae bacterium]|nr:diaminopimelate epimerase [Lachnospiraceae bacterium]